MRRLKKMVFSMLLIVILSGLLIVIITTTVYNKLDKEEQKYEKYLGEVHIIDGDTVTITNYSILKETFIFSNGKEVNYKFISNKND